MSLVVPVIAVIIVGATLAIGALALRHATGEQRRQLLYLMLLRTAALVVIALALVNPAWRRPALQQTRPQLTLLVDASASVAAQLTAPGRRGKSRPYDDAMAALRSAAVREQLARFELRTLHFGDGLVEPPRGEPAEPATNLSLALSQTLGRYPPTPIVIISDGAETAGEARVTAAQAAGAGAPVYTVGIGATEPPPNVGPVVIQAPRVVRERQPVPVRVLVPSSGYSGPQPVRIEVDGKQVASLWATLSSGGAGSVQQQLPGLQVGFHLLTVWTPVRADEATTADNTRNQIIEARRDETRLVLLAGAPDPDYAALQRLLGRLPKLRADAYVRLGQGRYLHQQKDRTTRQAPDLPRLLRDAHVVMLMNYPVSEAEAGRIRSFVQNGGTVGWFAGKAAGWKPALPGPATPGASHAAVPTPLGAPLARGSLGEELARATSPTWWRNAPFLSGYTALSPRPGAEVVLRTGGNQPLLVTGTFGTGATLTFGGSGTYRWLLSPEADEESRRLHEAFWQTIIGWLSQPREQRRLVVMVDPAIAPEGQPVRLLAAVSGGAKVRAEIAGPRTKLAVPLAQSGETAGRYAASVSNLPPGKYTVRFVADTAGGTLQETRQLVVEAGGAELAVLVRQEGNLRAIAAAGKGQYAPVEQLAELLARLPAQTTSQSGTQPTHPFRTGIALAAMVALLSVEWWLRRRWGW